MKKMLILCGLIWCFGFCASAQFIRVEEDPIEGEFVGVYDMNKQLHIICQITCEEEVKATIECKDPKTKNIYTYCKDRRLKPNKCYSIGYLCNTGWDFKPGDLIIISCEGYGKYTVEIPPRESKEYLIFQESLQAVAQDESSYKEELQN